VIAVKITTITLINNSLISKSRTRCTRNISNKGLFTREGPLSKTRMINMEYRLMLDKRSKMREQTSMKTREMEASMISQTEWAVTRKLQ
jgi:hypothetical protein